MSRREKPILMNAFNVRAILTGRKTQTRRVIKSWIGADITDVPSSYRGFWRGMNKRIGTWVTESTKCPYGQPGDQLWVRETQWINGGYVASDPPNFPREGKTPSIHMPRWASRLTLELTDVRVERVQDISEADAQREGWDISNLPEGHCYDCTHHARDWFHGLWDSINAKQGFGWDTNPWVWVIEFRVSCSTQAARMSRQRKL